jgi:DNA-binding NtrC family response regulator
MQMGAIDYLVKPVDKDRLVAAVKRGLEFRSLRTEIMSLKDSMLREGPKRGDVFAGMLTQSKSMLTIFRYLEAIGPSSQPVLVTGESGTGKELVAQALHKLSGRSGELVSVDVAGLDDTMFSDTLFGHSRGAFSGAERPREGLVATAGDGTLFLDEIGDLSMASQVKLLRLLQDGTYRALGADEYRRSRARIIAATNRDVLTDVEAGRFRRDLYFRLKTHHLHLPPLRSRMSDLPMLLGHFIAKEAAEHGKAAPEIPTSLIQLLRTYGWPGNVRELKGMCIDAMARHEGTMLSLRSFRDSMAGKPMTAEPEDKLEKIASWLPDELPTLRDAEEALIAEAMRRVNGNQTLAAGILGLSRQALNKRLTRKKDTDEADDADQE